VLGRDLRQGGFGDRDLVDGGPGAGVSGAQLAGQRLAGLSCGPATPAGLSDEVCVVVVCDRGVVTP
jgi:hypothetical protein